MWGARHVGHSWHWTFVYIKTLPAQGRPRAFCGVGFISHGDTTPESVTELNTGAHCGTLGSKNGLGK